MRERVFALATAGVVLAAIALGLLTIGGPVQARLDRYDQVRYDDLAFLSSTTLPG